VSSRRSAPVRHADRLSPQAPLQALVCADPARARPGGPHGEESPAHSENASATQIPAGLSAGGYRSAVRGGDPPPVATLRARRLSRASCCGTSSYERTRGRPSPPSRPDRSAPAGQHGERAEVLWCPGERQPSASLSSGSVSSIHRSKTLSAANSISASAPFSSPRQRRRSRPSPGAGAVASVAVRRGHCSDLEPGRGAPASSDSADSSNNLSSSSRTRPPPSPPAVPSARPRPALSTTRVVARAERQLGHSMPYNARAARLPDREVTNGSRNAHAPQSIHCGSARARLPFP